MKAQKAQRLYAGKNAVAERLEKDFFSKLCFFLDTEGEIPLSVLEFELKLEEEVVYQSHDRNDSLAFLLYRDGIRRLSFHPGIEGSELSRFLACLNRVARLANEQDDLVTLFWEQDFTGIRYFAVEELGGNFDAPRLQERLESGYTAGGGSSAETVRLDLKQPVAAVPVEDCRLVEEEIQSLLEELSEQSADPFQNLVVELAIELTLLEEAASERDEIAQAMVGIADGLVEAGSVEQLIGLHEHLEGLATMLFSGSKSIAELRRRFMGAAAEPDAVDALLRQVDRLHVPKPEPLTVHLARLGTAALPALIPWMAAMSSPAYRRAVTTAVLLAGDDGLREIEKQLPLVRPAENDPESSLLHRQGVRELLYALSHHAGEKSIPILERLLEAEDPLTRRETAVTLSRYPEARVDELCLELVSNGDPEIRATALDTLVRRGRSELGRVLADRSLAAENFDDRPLTEKRRLFAAVAKLSGEAALPWLVELLVPTERRWFSSRRERHLTEAAAHGIRMVGTAKARRLLTEHADSPVRSVRAACLKELTERKV